MQYLGLRRAERLGLSWRQVKNLRTKGQAKIVIDQQLARRQDGSGWYLKPPKTDAGIREFPLPEVFRLALLDWKKTQDGYKQSSDWNPRPDFADLVFLRPDGSFYTLNRDNDDWHKLLDSYLDPQHPHWNGHLNRHITATILAELGTPPALAQKILGHASESMTYYYTAVTNKSMVEPLDLYGESL